MKHNTGLWVAGPIGILIALAGPLAAAARPNILIAISDDQSFPHASAYGSRMVSTPAFDRIARDGVLFTQAFAASPGCSPSRAAFLTGLHTWQIEHAGTHASYFDPAYISFPDHLAAQGYFSGSTGKGWAPGDWKRLGRTHNPAGRSWSAPPGPGRYARAFQRFLEERPADKPFCFWFGSSDPHRGYAAGSGRKKGKKLADAEVPGFLPDTTEIRDDLLDYSFEVERFDDDLDAVLEVLESEGELDNTLIIVTSDNGMPFPRAKANCYEWGIHMPLAIHWSGKIPPGRTVDDLVGFVDLTATIYDAAGIKPPTHSFPPSGRSLLSVLKSNRNGLVDPLRIGVYAARERHSSSRYHSLGYPQRCLRTQDYLLIRNFRPERWPAGPSRKYSSARWNSAGDLVESSLQRDHLAYHDIDACPSLSFLVANRDDPELGRFLDLAVARRPEIELYRIREDADCLHNLAGDPALASVQQKLEEQLERTLRETGDRRILDGGDIWETYPRVSGLRWFPEPDWIRDGTRPAPKQPWLEQRRPQSR